MIIGLTGRNAAGKGEVARFLEEAGFEYHSLSDILREEIKKKGLTVTRDRLIETGTRLRSKEGLGVLADRTLARLGNDRNYVIDSIRNPEEVKALRRRNDFLLLNITAPRDLRFRRIKERARESDPKTLKAFIVLEEREFSSANPASQQLRATEQLANVKIPNAGSLDQLREKVRTTVMRFAESHPRPSWDVYFMGIAQVVSLRSNCLKRRVAALLVKEKRIIASGYNGTPRGVQNCHEGGCPRCKNLGASGAQLEECFCSHAEENAITQSAYHGVNIKDATLYTTFSPCLMCAKMIINSGIREVVYSAQYPLMNVAGRLLKEAGIKLRKLV